MFRTPCLAAIIGIAFLTASAAVPDKSFAVTADYSTEGATPLDPASVNTEQQQYAQRGGGRGGGGKRGGGGRSPGSKPSNRPSGGPGGPGAGPGGPGGAGPGGPGGPGAGPGGPSGPSGNVNVNVNRSANVTVKNRGYGWRGSRWGAVVFGVTLGTAIVVVANTPPPPPDPSLCWTWNNDALTEGYWYYCEGP